MARPPRGRSSGLSSAGPPGPGGATAACVLLVAYRAVAVMFAVDLDREFLAIRVRMYVATFVHLRVLVVS